MAPFVAALLGAAGVGGAYLLFRKPEAPKTSKPVGLADTLNKGQTYAILAMVDWTKIPGAVAPGGGGYQTPDLAGNARYVKEVFTNLGFKVLSDPQTRDEAEAKKFFAGQPSLWVFNGQWTKDAKIVDLPADLRPIFPTTAFYILPVS